jgi:tetrahydromethanopterin S-methyltransferase subunit C
MIHIYLPVIIALLITAMVIGAIVAVLTVISVGTRRERLARSFTTDSPSRAASGTRALTGYYAKTEGATVQQAAASPYWPNLRPPRPEMSTR